MVFSHYPILSKNFRIWDLGDKYAKCETFYAKMKILTIFNNFFNLDCHSRHICKLFLRAILRQRGYHTFILQLTKVKGQMILNHVLCGWKLTQLTPIIDKQFPFKKLFQHLWMYSSHWIFVITVYTSTQHPFKPSYVSLDPVIQSVIWLSQLDTHTQQFSN